MDDTMKFDLSDEAINRQVKQMSKNNMLTRYAPAFGIGVALLTTILELPWYGYALAIVLILSAGANTLLQTFVYSKKLAETLRQQILANIEELSQLEINALDEKLKAVKRDHAAKQLLQMSDSFKHYKDKLHVNLKGKRGLSQCLAAAEEMRGAALHNLNLIVDYEGDIQMLDVEDSRHRIEQLGAKGGNHESEIADHQKQIKMAEKMEGSISRLIEKIEGAITSLKEASIGLNDVQLGKSGDQDISMNVEKFKKVAELNRSVYTEVTSFMKEFK